jgi:hypothetical protein
MAVAFGASKPGSRLDVRAGAPGRVFQEVSMIRPLRSAVMALAGLGAVALTAGSAFADDWDHRGDRGRRDSYRSYRRDHNRGYGTRYAYVRPSTRYVAPVVYRPAVVLSSTCAPAYSSCSTYSSYSYPSRSTYSTYSSYPRSTYVSYPRYSGSYCR